MIVNVRMIAFEDANPDGSVKIRKVDIGEPAEGELQRLEQVFYFGQNDFQPQPCCSVSVGDVAELDGKLFLCAPMGWKEISTEQYDELLALDRRDRSLAA